MAKTGQDRIDASIDYIAAMGEPGLALHLQGLVAPQATVIGQELSLGFWQGGTKSQRAALRALLLCQRVYFSDLWCLLSPIGGVQGAVNWLAPDWKTTSLRHWETQTEFAIREGIRTFAITSSNRGDLVRATGAMPNKNVGHPILTMTRTMRPFPGMVSCYGAVITWLFQSGIVSYRWYLRHCSASDQTTLEAAFGQGRQLIGPNDKFGPGDPFPIVPPGHIVHLYAAEGGTRWNGHWLVSLGGGLGAGCNNDATDGTPNAYTPSCSLAAQMINGYRDERSPGVYWKGIADVFDPLQLPSRM